MIPVEQQKDPRNDIGPFYKSLGFLALVLAFVVIIIQALKGQHVGWHDVALIAICALLCICLWRPDNFDTAIKAIADHLPSFSFTRREVTAEETSEHMIQTNGE